MDATNRREKVELRAEPAGDREEIGVAWHEAEREEIARLEKSQAAGLLRLAKLVRGAA